MTPLVQTAGWTLVHFVWQGVLVAIVTGVILEFLAFRSARARYLVACLGLLAMLAAPALTLALASGSGASSPLTATDIGSSSIDPYEFRAWPVLKPASPGETALDARAGGDTLLAGIVGMWAAGVSLLLIRMAGGWWRVRRLHRLALASELSAWQPVCDRIAASLTVKTIVRVAESALVETPSVVGWLQPVILLPVSALSGLTPAQVEAILAHELAHIRRHDFAINLLQSIAETLLFYHPAVWWMSARIRAEREYCCDDVAVAFSGDALNYASALAELETRRSVMVLAASGGSLLDRVGRLLRVPADDGAQTTGWLVTLVLTMLFVAGAGVVQWLPDTIGHTQAAPQPPAAPRAPGPVAPATPSTPVAPAPAVAPAPPAGQAAPRPANSDGVSIRLRDEDFRMRWQSGWSSREISGWGDLTFNDDLTDVRLLSSGGYLLVREWVGLLPRSVEIRSEGGRLVHRYFVAGFERPWNADAERWLAERLPSMVRRSGLGARSRVREIYAARGIDGVLDEIREVDGDYARRIYLRELRAAAEPFDPSTVVRAITFAGSAMSSDYHLAETLRDLAPIAANDGAATRAYANAADRLQSDYEHRRALVALFKAGRRSPDTSELALASAGNIHSNYERVEALRVAVREGWLGTGETLFKSIEQMNSDYEKQRILSIVLKERPDAPDIQKRLLVTAATIDSNYECAEFLLSFLRAYGLGAANRVAFFAAVDTLDSSYERQRVLAELVRSERGPEVVHDVLAAIAMMTSDYDRAEMLLLVLKRQVIDSAARQAMLEVVEKIGSSYDQGRVLVAMVRADRR